MNLSPQHHSFFSNPIWCALTTRQAHLALRIGDVLRFPPEIAPFCAIEHDDVPIDAEPLLAHGDIYFAGALPRLSPGNFETSSGTVLQMIYTKIPGATPAEPLPPHITEVELTSANAQEMVDLTTIAFPGFFRKDTGNLGKYLGLRIDGQLVAMAGERFRFPGLREISAVCTRPGFTGRGFARHLMLQLMRSGDPDTPFLHVSATNSRAAALYPLLGYELVGSVPLLQVSPLRG